MNGAETNRKIMNIREWKRGYRILFRLFMALVIAAVSQLVVSTYYDTPKKNQIHRENHHILEEYNILLEKISSAEHTLADIKHRDQFVYRPLLGIDTLDMPKVYLEYNDSKYAEFEGVEYGDVVTRGWRMLDGLTRKTYYASKSLDDTQDLAENKEEFSLVIPAIWPIDRTKLRSVSSLYGMRMHPRYGTWRMHEGIDLAAPIGTIVYATGNAVVSYAGWQRGYGNLIELNHGFGYKTRYGHLDEIYVCDGDSVTRGQVIAAVGNTGVSSGPHLHYEVRFRNQTVNPIHYFNKDMSPEAYLELMQQLEISSTNK